MPQDGEGDKYLAGPIDDSMGDNLLHPATSPGTRDVTEQEKFQVLSRKMVNIQAIFGRKLLDQVEDQHLKELDLQADDLRSASQVFEKHPKKTIVQAQPEKSKSTFSWKCLFTCCFGRDDTQESNVGLLDDQLTGDHPYMRLQ